MRRTARAKAGIHLYAPRRTARAKAGLPDHGIHLRTDASDRPSEGRIARQRNPLDV
jgi:hypothetical protein